VKERRWTLWVRDERGRRHRGLISYTDAAPADPPSPPATFHIALLVRPADVSAAPAATAVCVPKLTKASAIVGDRTAVEAASAAVSGLKRGILPEALHAQYGAGRIVVPAGEVDARKVFPPGRTHVDLEHLALLLVERASVEAMAPYIAIIRRELRVPPGGNALLALETRLSPADPRERPPARAPGIVRLRAALRHMKIGALPGIAIEAMSEDLRFLRLFEREEHALRRDALDRLLADVIGGPRVATRPAKGGRRAKGTIVPLRRRREA
jgi:hypothetical protein